MDKNKLWPGELSHGKFPVPTEIACIWVKKIYDACSQKDCDEFEFEFEVCEVNADEVNLNEHLENICLPEVAAEDLAVECKIKPCSEGFKEWSIEPIDDGPLAIVKVKVFAILEIKIYDVNEPSTYEKYYRKVSFKKEVILYAPDPDKMQVLVESIFESLLCTIEPVYDGEEFIGAIVTATVGAFIIVKTGLEVQLLVPAYGFCPVPPECEELGDICEQFLERPFPPFFPPQLNDLPEND